ncbi:isoleucine--tRNA ligase [Flaviflexus equikiangi]|uniref:Isoleucine--tRNA ligase n=1 Tax=Flaviflexus equikiangi TaxID=2758573 RepID=A0ABS2TED9_9ACTO|nr:isoleucine--tRNA ligase [Flaviflexus equikiangi]MBM9433024.1 isoleucine--tRNA ligase [Flaviflexus equikiangi]
MTEKSVRYPLHRDGDVVASPNFPTLEDEILAYWKKDKTFQASIDNREAGENGANEFVFYDGPPFANGLPHYGHLLTGYVKDLVGRFQTQIGRKVERRFGWDTHGLPAELEAQRLLGIETKDEIEAMGIDTFNAECRSSVLRYTKEWEDYVTRQARWVDFENDYKTLDTPYIESVIWAFKTLYDKGLAYEGHRVLPYCWNDETPLSNHELKMDDDVYKDRQDQTVTVGLRLETGELALIWTTTPWTLPSNLAVAVGPDVTYSVVRPTEGALAGERVILAADLLSSYEKELGEPEIVETLKGTDLVGRSYTPIFDYFASGEGEAPGPNAFRILSADFVTTEDGTGLVHLAPAFGEDDMLVCHEAGIIPVVPVDSRGVFTSEVADYAGMQVFEANMPIIRDLRDGTGPLAGRGEDRPVLVRQASYVHSYPHCWRCREPLIYKAVSSWFVKVTQFRDRMVELNEDITWVPDHIKAGQFGKWLAGARDWSISRNRYWGSPIPVWVSDNPDYPRTDVYGSLAEMERDFGRLPVNEQGEVDLHRPYIDELTRPNPDDPTGQSTMRRITDVLDCWFDSGSMPFAQVHYPFENQDWFENHYPGDFIVEYIGQTRGWFYTLHVLATSLFDKPSFRTSVSHGIVLGNDGQKMSKSLRNYPDVYEMFDEVGADAMRWFLMASPIVRGGNLIVTEQGLRDTVRQVLLPLWNTYYFFSLYAGTCNKGAGYEAKLVTDPSGLDVMDRYLLASTKKLADGVRGDLESYEIANAAERVRQYLDVLTNWYVRTSRDRFWDENTGSFDALYTALETLAKVIAPLAPLIAEEIWRGLTGGRSVHLTDWPVLPTSWEDDELVAVMNEARAVVSAAHSLRKAEKLRVRQPLRSLECVTTLDLAPFADLIASEVNVKTVTITRPAESGLAVSEELAVQPRELPGELRKLTSALFKAAKSGAWHRDGENVVMELPEPVTLVPGQFVLTTVVNAAEGDAATVLDSGSFVVIDTDLDDALIAEGYARDLIRAIQDTRKASGLHVSDRIRLSLTVPEADMAAVEANLDLITSETLAVQTEITEGDLAIVTEKTS